MTFDPRRGQRIGPAWEALLAYTASGNWFLWSIAVDQISSSTGLHPKTISNLIHDGVSAGRFERRGSHRDGSRAFRQVSAQ